MVFLERTPERKRGLAHWQGFGLTGGALDRFIYQTSAKIDTLWEAQYEKPIKSPFGIQTYREVVSQVGYFAQNVIGRCFEWTNSGDPIKRDIGMKIITHNMLNATLSAVEKLREHFPEIKIEEDELFEIALENGPSSVQLFNEKATLPLHQVYSKTYHQGLRMIAQTLGIDVTSVRDMLRSFAAFLDHFAQEYGRLPELREVHEKFPPGYFWPIDMLREHPVFRSGIKGGMTVPHRREPLVQPFGDPEKEAEWVDLMETIERVREKLTDKEKVTLQRIFLDELTNAELAHELGSSRRLISARARTVQYKLKRDEGINDYAPSTSGPAEQPLINSAINALHAGNYGKAWDFLSRSEALLSARNTGWEPISGVASNPTYPAGKNADVDKLRFIWKLKQNILDKGFRG